MIATKPVNVHMHEFTKRAIKSVLVYRVTTHEDGGSSVAAKDKLLLRLCTCGKYQAYDLQRTVV